MTRLARRVSYRLFYGNAISYFISYGENGFRVGIEYRDDNRCRHIKRSFVTMQEYYAFRIQEREAEGNTLLLGGRLLQQYIVDAFTCIEEERLRWVRLNQLQLRCEVYEGLKDAVVRGETTPSSIGKRIVLPSSFTGSPRYMIQNFQDAMAICRWVGHPDIFLTFTCNAKWQEIQQLIQKTSGLKVEDRPDIIARVFKIKLDELMKDLRKGHHFGRVIAAIYTIEYQKRGLPHAHILLWLHADYKISSNDEIDKIISAEIPDLDEDPVGYSAVAEYMLHGPCGSAFRESPYMNRQTNSCSKHFPRLMIMDFLYIEEEMYLKDMLRNIDLTFIL
uniref:Helitron helicase-like domain-containing protein n=1 Tax=Ananas comosus var. bracteatus TaxID=296719 RepID=A0A6V7NHA2_ANACO|nr:unnamed protein product [Ananas comosus var. bracteatus]